METQRIMSRAETQGRRVQKTFRSPFSLRLRVSACVSLAAVGSSAHDHDPRSLLDRKQACVASNHRTMHRTETTQTIATPSSSSTPEYEKCKPHSEPRPGSQIASNHPFMARPFQSCLHHYMRHPPPLWATIFRKSRPILSLNRCLPRFHQQGFALEQNP